MGSTQEGLVIDQKKKKGWGGWGAVLSAIKNHFRNLKIFSTKAILQVRLQLTT